LMDIAAPRESRYYWRGAVYAHYEGDRWETMENEHNLLIRGRQPTGVASDALRCAVVQIVTTLVPARRLLVGASQPVSVDQEAEASVDLAVKGAPLELLRILSVDTLEAGDQYVVTSRVSDADEKSLRRPAPSIQGGCANVTCSFRLRRLTGCACWLKRSQPMPRTPVRQGGCARAVPAP